MSLDPLKKIGEVGEETAQAVEELSENVLKGLRSLTGLVLPTRKGSVPLKRSLTGYEVEMFVLDERGDVAEAAPLLEAARKRKLPVEAEMNVCVIEMLCLPHKNIRNTSLSLVRNLIDLVELAASMGLKLYPCATYPGAYTVRFPPKERYLTIEKIMGKEGTRLGIQCTGFHQHYTLPRGVFDRNHTWLKQTTTSKVQRSLLHSHNFLVAAHPALTAMLQSSPFLDGKRYTKDARTVIYGSGRAFDEPRAMFSQRAHLNELDRYHHTVEDLSRDLHKRYDLWSSLIERHAPQTKKRLLVKKKALSYNWGPIKVNPKGTLEYRGMDMNFLSNILGGSAIMKAGLRSIQQDFTVVTPVDISARDAFKREGSIIFVPPQSLVRERLQKESAHKGFASADVRNYANQLYKFARDELRAESSELVPLLSPIAWMIDEERTVSDDLIKFARRRGCTRDITRECARSIALHMAEKFEKDLDKALTTLEKLYD